MVLIIDNKGYPHQDLMLVDKELMLDVITVGHHHISLGDALTWSGTEKQRHQEPG